MLSIIKYAQITNLWNNEVNKIQTGHAKLDTDEPVEIDFEGVSSLSPSWGDEFLSPLLKTLKDKLILFNTTNLSVDATIDFLAEINKGKFNRKS